MRKHYNYIAVIFAILGRERKKSGESETDFPIGQKWKCLQLMNFGTIRVINLRSSVTVGGKQRRNIKRAFL